MLISMKTGKTVAFGASLMLLASCSLSELTAETENNIEDASVMAANMLEKAALPDTPEVIDTVRTKSEIWLGNTSSKISEGEPLPARFETENAVTLVTNQELGLFEIAKKITGLTGLLVRVDDLLLDNGGTSNLGAETAMSVSYHGRLSGLLDQVASRFGLYWRYKRGIINFYEMETRSFTVYALPVESSVKNAISNSGSGGSKGESIGSSTSDISSDVTLEAWKQIEETISNMIPSSSKMSISSTNGTITVTAPPDTLVKVGRYVRDINEKLGRQVAITVRVLQVTLNKDHNYGLDLNAAFKNLGSWKNIAFQGATVLDASKLSGVLSGTFSTNHVDVDAVVQALSTQGDVAVVTTATVTTMNNKVAPVQVSKNQDYISKLETTTDGQGVVTYSTETETLNTGFNMDVLPRILDHGRLLLMFSMTLNTLDEMVDYVLPGSGGDTLSLPKTATRGFTQELIMRSGSTLVVTGFEETRDKLDKEGTGSADFIWLGGKRASEMERSVLVILITPEVLVSPLSPETRVNDI